MDRAGRGLGFHSPPDTKVTAAQVSALEDMPIPPEARKYWAFKSPCARRFPSLTQKPANPIDAFLLRAMEQHGLRPAPPANKRTLVRRAYLDLIGLPPFPAETEAFVNDNAPDAWLLCTTSRFGSERFPPTL